jgi:hypothetical protein
MPDNRGSRFALEVLFLLALAVALTLADLKPIEIAGIMLLGWLIVAALEWAAWREKPHYGSGLPPRYYVPQVSLPPAQPLEQDSARYSEAGYPESRDEAPTWIASAALREEMLGIWPVAAPAVTNGAGPEQEVEPAPVLDPDPVEESEAESEAASESEPSETDPYETDPYETDPWTREQELPAAPLDELDQEAQPEPQTHPVAVAAVQPPDSVQEADAAPKVLPDSVQGLARYSLDPLADRQPRRRFGRGGTPELVGVVDVPARPAGLRALPGRTNRQD